jgi:methylmalonyl-CoA mutase N-terminal domain/subunit
VQRAIDRGEQIVVGVNRYRDAGDGASSGGGSAPLFHVDPAVEARQITRIRRLRETRNRGEWQTALDGVSRAAADGTNLVPPIVAAVEARATVGEVADAMRLVFGEFDENR